MSDFMNKAKEFVDKHEKQVDQGLEKAGDMVDKRTGGRYGEQIDRGVDQAQARTGEGEQPR
ncbi:antitoxin [Micromonospora sp. NPDC047074]|uniref:antitoxin n=1 Tax=Micromonospora sp. NPDC047074 TaxID=3154339 RepID=UPI0034053BB5